MERRKEKKLVHLFLVITLLDQKKKKIETIILIGMCIKFGLEDSDLVLLEIEKSSIKWVSLFKTLDISYCKPLLFIKDEFHKAIINIITDNW